MQASIKTRIKETCTESLKSWINKNNQEISYKWYFDHPILKAEIQSETDYIKAVLSERNDIKCQN